MKLRKQKKSNALTVDPFAPYVPADFSITDRWTRKCYQFERLIKRQIARFGGGLDQYSAGFADKEIDAEAAVEKQRLRIQLQEQQKINVATAFRIQSELDRLQAEKAMNQSLLIQLNQAMTPNAPGIPNAPKKI